MNHEYELIKAMNEVVGYLNHEDGYARWIYIVPDGASPEDLKDIAEDPELMDLACKSFTSIIRAYGKYGYFTGKRKAWGQTAREED